MSKFRVNNVRISYPNLHTPSKPGKDGKAGKYQATLMIPKESEAHAEVLKAIMEDARTVAKARFGDQIGNKFKWPVKDGDKQENWDTPKPEYAGHWIISTRSNDKPGLVDQFVKPITDTSIPMPGDFCNVTFSVYAFEADGSKGVTCGLNNVQFVKKGETLGNRKRAEDEFEPIEVGGDDGGGFYSESESDDIPF